MYLSIFQGNSDFYYRQQEVGAPEINESTKNKQNSMQLN